MHSSQSSLGTMNVVHTRTDAFIHSIPTNRIGSALDEAAREKLGFIHEPVVELAVEHLSMIRSEQDIRDLLDALVESASQKILLIFVDMSRSSATEQINFTRMQVESEIHSLAGKSVVLVLHYPPSSLLHSPYPALFLGGWDHNFLDGILPSSLSVHIEKLVENACLETGTLRHDVQEGQDLSRNLMSSLLPRTVPLIAAHGLLDVNQKANFSSRTDIANSLLGQRVSSSTVAEILCSRFATIWLNRGLVGTVAQASQSLVEKKPSFP